MNEFRINSRVKHRVFGLGTVINMSERFLMVLFDDGETRRFISDALYAMAFSDIQVEKSSEKIKIQRIFIKNLFERLDYDIVINNTNSVAILSAPNGCGKTTIFKILTFVLNPEMNIFSEIKSVPFSIFSCYLSNGKTVSLQRESLKPQDNNAKKGHNISVYDIAMSIFSEPFDWVFKISEEQKELVSVSLAQTIYEYRNGGNSSSYRDDVGEYEEPVYGTRRSLSIVNRWFYVINASLRKHNCIVFIDFIEANRLQKKYDSISTRSTISYGDFEYSRNRSRETEKIDYLLLANEEMTGYINNWLQDYNRRLSEAKNKLPSMYIDVPDTLGEDYPVFRERWNTYHKELNKFHEIGILESAETVILQTDLETAYEKKSAFLTTYLDAFEGTLEPLQLSYAKLRLFADIFNKRNEITQKIIKFTPGGIRVISSGKEISIEYLSSGEKNDFVMFYRLIFNTYQNGIVLIDEPEISLHIEWQEEYLDRLIEICKMNGLQAIVATHSPSIINGHLDLFVDKR